MAITVDEVLIEYKKNKGKKILSFTNNEITFSEENSEYRLKFSDTKEGLFSVETRSFAVSDLSRSINIIDEYNYLCIMEYGRILFRDESLDILMRAFGWQTNCALFLLAITSLYPTYALIFNANFLSLIFFVYYYFAYRFICYRKRYVLDIINDVNEKY